METKDGNFISLRMATLSTSESLEESVGDDRLDYRRIRAPGPQALDFKHLSTAFYDSKEVEVSARRISFRG